MSTGISSNSVVMRSNAENNEQVATDPCSTITPDRDERREQFAGIHGYTMETTEGAKYNDTVCRYVSSCRQPNIIENEHYPLERDNSLSLSTRTKSQDTAPSGNDIIDVGINTPKMPSECGDDVKLVSPPKIGKRTGEAAEFFGSWSSPPNTGALESPIPYVGRKNDDQPTIPKTTVGPYGLFQYPPSSPVSSFRPNLASDRDVGRPLPLPSDSQYPFSNLPTAFRTKSWGSEIARPLTEKCLSSELMRNGSFEAPPYRFSGLGTNFTPQMSLNANYSAPLSITDSFESQYPNYSSRVFSAPYQNIHPYAGSTSDDRFVHRPFPTFNEHGTPFRHSFPAQEASCNGHIMSHHTLHWPPVVPSNMGYRTSSTTLNQDGNFTFLGNQVTSNTGIQEVPECAKSMADSPTVRLGKQRPKTATCIPPNASNAVRKKPSRAAQAAIAAGMTVPAVANEVPFDILDPPLTPVIPPSTRPVCSVLYDMNPNDVLLGRGGGTNNQLGNQRFRTLVQQFQPIYLLCRRKDKPLIARSVVLIIRKRGGRFLRKDDGGAMLYEVGDIKAEAKTSQALREGLDVRANRTSLPTPKAAKHSNPKATGPLMMAPFTHPENGMGDQRDNYTAPDVFGAKLRKDKSSKQDSVYYHHLSKSGFGQSSVVEGRGSTYGPSRPHHTYPPPYYTPYTYIHPSKPQNFHGPNGHQAFSEVSRMPSSYGPRKNGSENDIHSNFYRDT